MTLVGRLDHLAETGTSVVDWRTYDEMTVREAVERIRALESALRHQLAVHRPAAQGCAECDRAAALVVA